MLYTWRYYSKKLYQSYKLLHLVFSRLSVIVVPDSRAHRSISASLKRLNCFFTANKQLDGAD